MHLQSKTWVDKPIDQVTKFFYAPGSLEKWDRSVSSVIAGTTTSPGPGYTFQTIAPSGIKMSYKVIEFDSERSVKILLTNSRMFKKAIWHFQFDPENEGTVIACHVYFTLKPQYLFLYPVLYLNKKALARDLSFFKAALNEN